MVDGGILAKGKWALLDSAWSSSFAYNKRNNLFCLAQLVDINKIRELFDFGNCSFLHHVASLSG